MTPEGLVLLVSVPEPDYAVTDPPFFIRDVTGEPARAWCRDTPRAGDVICPACGHVIGCLGHVQRCGEG